jgi:UDP-glucose 4-epimerase
VKKVLILGGTGYLGSNIALHLSSYCSITVAGRKSLNPYFRDSFEEKGVNFQQVDISYLKKVFKLIDINDYIIFAVPNTQPHQSRPFFHSDYLKIVLPSKKIFEYASRINKKVIFLSSGGSVYGEGVLGPHNEYSIPKPITKYGKYKLVLDNSLLSLNFRCDSKNVVLRISNPYGGTYNNFFQQGFVNSVIRNVKNGNLVEIWGDGHQIRDFIYIKDVLKLVELVMNDDVAGIYNCGSGVGYTLREIIEKAQEVSDSRIEVKFIESYTERIKSNILNIKKANDELGWRPEYELLKTFTDLVTQNN